MISTERMIVAAFVAVYAIFVDLQAAIARSIATSLHDFQVLPLIIWGAVISTVALVYVIAVFREQISDMVGETQRALKAAKKKEIINFLVRPLKRF